MRLTRQALTSLIGLSLASRVPNAVAARVEPSIESSTANTGPLKTADSSDGAMGEDATEVPLRVLIELHADSQGMLPLLRAELEGLGLEVVERSSDPTSPSRDDTERHGETFRIVVKPQQVEVWILDVGANTIVHHEVFAKADGSPLAMRTAVLHAVELLGWSLRERQRKAAPQGRTSTLRTPGAKGAAPTSAQWLITLTPLLLHSPGGTDPSGGAALDLDLAE
ncbi:MAG: hypothetical protein QM784_33415 [Polyangiaceae bacterium]